MLTDVKSAETGKETVIVFLQGTLRIMLPVLWEMKTQESVPDFSSAQFTFIQFGSVKFNSVLNDGTFTAEPKTFRVGH